METFKNILASVMVVAFAIILVSLFALIIEMLMPTYPIVAKCIAIGFGMIVISAVMHCIITIWNE